MEQDTSKRARTKTGAKVAKERRKLCAFLRKKGLESGDLDDLNHEIENVAWMRVKLAETREQIADEPLTVKYDNGGGQQGTKENPIYNAYESLWKTYKSALQLLMENLPRDAASELETEQKATALELVQLRRQREA